MEYKVLALGDVASETGLQLLEKKLRAFKKEHDVRFTVVNGENISGSGLTKAQAEALFAAGADVITLGNHTFGKPQIAAYLDEERYILRPANFTGRAPGHGYQMVDCGPFTVAVMVLIGRCDLDFNAENPFTTADKLLKAQTDKPTFTLVEFHAGATSEKAGHGLPSGWPCLCPLGYPHPRAYGGYAGIPQGYRLCHRSWHDRPHPFCPGHPAGAVRGVFPGRSAGPLSGGGGPLLRPGVHFYPEQRHGAVRKSG